MTVHCVDEDTPLKLLATRMFDGTNWEASYAATDIGRLASTPAAAAPGAGASAPA